MAMMVAFWGLIIGAGYLLVTRLGRGESTPTPREPSALELLERRYARGELSPDEFEAMRQRLTAAPSAVRRADDRGAAAVRPGGSDPTHEGEV